MKCKKATPGGINAGVLPFLNTGGTQDGQVSKAHNAIDQGTTGTRVILFDYQEMPVLLQLGLITNLGWYI